LPHRFVTRHICADHRWRRARMERKNRRLSRMATVKHLCLTFALCELRAVATVHASVLPTGPAGDTNQCHSHARGLAPAELR
jgi:hypothetical protein